MLLTVSMAMQSKIRSKIRSLRSLHYTTLSVAIVVSGSNFELDCMARQTTDKQVDITELSAVSTEVICS